MESSECFYCFCQLHKHIHGAIISAEQRGVEPVVRTIDPAFRSWMHEPVWRFRLAPADCTLVKTVYIVVVDRQDDSGEHTEILGTFASVAGASEAIRQHIPT